VFGALMPCLGDQRFSIAGMSWAVIALPTPTRASRSFLRIRI
jgi:hypothetical protein